jgi:hypothetical protein
VSRHEAEQMFLPLKDSSGMEQKDFLLEEDPIFHLINRARNSLLELKPEIHHDDSIYQDYILALVEVDHPKVQLNRVNATEELEKLLKFLKFSFMRSLGGSMLKAKGEK